MTKLLFWCLAVAAAVPAAIAAAQATPPAPHVLRGTTTTASGTPIAGANVFLLESLDGALTDSAGKFVIRTTAQGQVTVVARQIGFAPASVVVPVDTSGPIAIMLARQAAVLKPITVRAGAYTAGDERGMTLTALDVVRIPGAMADVARAMQTFPGVQSVDDGNALFVRGGDASETKYLLNNTVLLTPYNYETPTGNFTTSVNPFQLDGIAFNSGGAGARYGNLLSGVSDLRTTGRPARSSYTGVVGLAGASAEADLSLAHNVGVHATAGHSDTRYLFKMNGATRAYTPAPNGTDLSGSVIYNYRPTAELKMYAIDRHSSIGLGVGDPLFHGGYSTDSHSSMVQAGWSDVFGTLAPTISVSYASVRRDDGYGGVFDLGNEEHLSQLFTQTAWSLTDRLTVRSGGDLDWHAATFVGTIPKLSSDRGPGARTTTFDSRADGGRNGVFSEADWRALEDLRLTLGVRTDYSSFTHERTVDPRLSAAYRIGDATLTAAAGDYHQVSDPLYFASGIGTPGLGPMGSRQYVLGGEIGEGKRLMRVEAYEKRYHDLVGLTRDKVVVGGGTGEAKGIDFMVSHALWPYATTRTTYSYVDTRRTDPNTGLMTRTAYDITHSIFFILDQAFPKGWSVNSAFRYSTGKPFTPVTGGTYDAVRGIWMPVYGATNSQRMPPNVTLDLSVSRVKQLSPRTVLVYFFSLDNILDRENLYQYAYNADYTQRIQVRGIVKRTFYIGASLTRLGN